MKTETFYNWPFYKYPGVYIAGNCIYYRPAKNVLHCMVMCFEHDSVPYFMNLN